MPGRVESGAHPAVPNYPHRAMPRARIAPVSKRVQPEQEDTHMPAGHGRSLAEIVRLAVGQRSEEQLAAWIRAHVVRAI
jgi:hypothetical protein